MPPPTKLGWDPLTERDLYYLFLPALTALTDLAISPHFACLIAADVSTGSSEDQSSFANKLLLAGASYVCTWGPGCERLHDDFDEAQLSPDWIAKAPKDSVVMTTWHDDESLEETLIWFLDTTFPDEPYVATTRTGLVIVVGNRDWGELVVRALKAPDAFRAANYED